jgi:hypothetical protein
MAGGSNGYRAALVRSRHTLVLISSLPGTAGLSHVAPFSFQDGNPAGVKPLHHSKKKHCGGLCAFIPPRMPRPVLYHHVRRRSRLRVQTVEQQALHSRAWCHRILQSCACLPSQERTSSRTLPSIMTKSRDSSANELAACTESCCLALIRLQNVQRM